MTDSPNPVDPNDRQIAWPEFRWVRAIRQVHIAWRKRTEGGWENWLINKEPILATDALRTIKRRSIAAGLSHKVCCHTFRATGITAYLENGGTSVGIPYRDFAINSQATAALVLTLPRMSVGGVYSNMITDLDSAEANLPVLSVTPPPAGTFLSYRATKAAAIALKMRIKLYLRK